MSRLPPARLGLAPALLALALTAAPAAAQTDYFWNAPTGGTGTWDTATQLWSTTATGPVDYTWTNSRTERANFGNTGGIVSISSGPITAYGVNFTADGYTIGLGTLTLAGAGGLVSVGSGLTATINSTLAGTVGLTKSGAGTLVLGGTNTFTGPVAVNAGVLSVSADANLGTAPGVATPGSIVLNTGTLLATSTFTLDPNRGVTVGTGTSGGAGTVNVAANQTLTYNGVIANNGGVASQLNKTGAGTLVLGGANTYTGGTFISNGTVILNNLQGLGTAGQQTVAPTGSNDGGLLINVAGNFGRLVAMGVLNDTGTGRAVVGSQTGVSGDVTFTASSFPVRRSFTIQAGATRTIFGMQIVQGGTTTANITISAPVAATTVAQKVVFTNPRDGQHLRRHHHRRRGRAERRPAVR